MVNKLLLDHFIHLVNAEVNSSLKLTPKLTLEHIHLTPYSVINVGFAVQVLSSTITNVLKNYCGEETHDIAMLSFLNILTNFSTA